MSRPARPYRAIRLNGYRDDDLLRDFDTKEERANACPRGPTGKEWRWVTVVSRIRRPAKPEGHNWAWALKQLHKGKKVRRTSWSMQGSHLSETGRGEIRVFDGTFDWPFTFSVLDCDDAKDWVLA